jgi:hypothetical protein
MKALFGDLIATFLLLIVLVRLARTHPSRQQLIDDPRLMKL